LAQVVAPQEVPCGYFLHAPDPSQKPVCWHVLVASVEHSLSGSLSTPMLPHVPFVPAPFFAAVQAWQIPPHGASQHTPSTQLLLAHCVAAVQSAPNA
jgi:hypothetical protein